jgi:hypothetical protein
MVDEEAIIVALLCEEAEQKRGNDERNIDEFGFMIFGTLGTKKGNLGHSSTIWYKMK